jgi:Raf kinase inhibitor-like YbhB/YbcL family protein
MKPILKITLTKKLAIASLPLVGILLIAFSYMACSKENSNETNSSAFVLKSSEIQPDSLLPKEYTCDGESSTLPLSWNGFPEDTKYFALIMHHEASVTDIHWYWVMYNIPVSVQSLEKNVTGIGILGNNSVNGNIGYAPPCSQGPGSKRYTFTIYALSEPATLTVPASEVSREVLLQAIKNITLASATLTVIYSRDV